MAAKTKLRRLKRVPLSEENLAGIFTGSPFRMAVKGFPKDAKFLGANYDIDRRCFMLCYEHESFAEVREFEVVPIFDAVVVAKSARELKRLMDG